MQRQQPRKRRADEHEVNQPPNRRRHVNNLSVMHKVPENIDILDDFDSYGQREQTDIRLVLVGKTGSGKSATGNTILSKTEFKSQASTSSITSECKLGENRMEDCRYIVIDTPGLFDTNLPQGKSTKEIIRCIHMSLPGPHAFLLVLTIGRFTIEEIETFDQIFELFGERMKSFAVILFTRLEDLESEGITVQEYIDRDRVGLKKLVEKCQGRYIAFNNKASEQQRAIYVLKLKRILDNMIQTNSGKHYTNEMYKEAEAELQKKIKELERQKAVEKQLEVEKIEANLDSKFKGERAANEKLRSALEKRNDDLKQMHSESQRQNQQYLQKMTKDAETFQKELKKRDDEATARYNNLASRSCQVHEHTHSSCNIQ